MARFETTVANRLRADPAVAAIVGSGPEAKVLDFDYRGAGWNTAPIDVLDTYGRFIRPTLVVDDAGGSVPIFSRMRFAEQGRIYVWAFGNRTAAHAADIDDLMKAVRLALHDWQDPATKQYMRWTMRLGKVPADDGMYDRQEFTVGGIPIEE